MAETTKLLKQSSVCRGERELELKLNIPKDDCPEKHEPNRINAHHLHLTGIFQTDSKISERPHSFYLFISFEPKVLLITGAILPCKSIELKSQIRLDAPAEPLQNTLVVDILETTASNRET